jgi:hypothetical protein
MFYGFTFVGVACTCALMKKIGVSSISLQAFHDDSYPAWNLETMARILATTYLFLPTSMALILRHKVFHDILLGNPVPLT